MQEKPLSQHVSEMKDLSKMLVDQTYPNVSFEEELIVLPLKCRTLVIDGYEVSVNFSISNFEKHDVESVQIQSVYTPFLPFNIICRLARSFLGHEHLCYVDFIKQNKKIYCWTVKRTKYGRPMPAKEDQRVGFYEGFEYTILNPGSVNLYES